MGDFDVDDLDYDQVIYWAFGVFGGLIVFFSICCACCNRRRKRKSDDSNQANQSNQSNHSKRSSESNNDDGKVYVVTNVLCSHNYSKN